MNVTATIATPLVSCKPEDQDAVKINGSSFCVAPTYNHYEPLKRRWLKKANPNSIERAITNNKILDVVIIIKDPISILSSSTGKKYQACTYIPLKEVIANDSMNEKQKKLYLEQIKTNREFAFMSDSTRHGIKLFTHESITKNIREALQEKDKSPLKKEPNPVAIELNRTNSRRFSTINLQATSNSIFPSRPTPISKIDSKEELEILKNSKNKLPPLHLFGQAEFLEAKDLQSNLQGRKSTIQGNSLIVDKQGIFYPSLFKIRCVNVETIRSKFLIGSPTKEIKPETKELILPESQEISDLKIQKKIRNPKLYLAKINTEVYDRLFEKFAKEKLEIAMTAY